MWFLIGLSHFKRSKLFFYCFVLKITIYLDANLIKPFYQVHLFSPIWARTKMCLHLRSVHTILCMLKWTTKILGLTCDWTSSRWGGGLIVSIHQSANLKLLLKKSKHQICYCSISGLYANKTHIITRKWQHSLHCSGLFSKSADILTKTHPRGKSTVVGIHKRKSALYFFKNDLLSLGIYGILCIMISMLIGYVLEFTKSGLIRFVQM